MEIYDLLKLQNAKIRSNLRKLEDSAAHQPRERESLFREVRERIRKRNRVEDSFLYPLLLNSDRTHDGVLSSREENGNIENLILEMEEMEVTDPGFQNFIERLHSEFQRLVEREEKGLFPEAEEVIPPEQADLLRQRVESAFRVSSTELPT